MKRKREHRVPDKLNPLIIFYGIMVMLGSLVGIVIFNGVGGDTSILLSKVVNGYIAVRETGDIISVIFSTFSLNLIIVLTCIISGYIPKSIPIIIIATLTKGISYGFIISSIYNYTQHSYTYILTTILPFYIISSLLIIYLAKMTTHQTLLPLNKINARKYLSQSTILLTIILITNIAESIAVIFSR